jgi:glycerophosphoryl diester phosphodiesterase
MTPLIVGHRGAAAEAPENSIEAMELALSLGAGALEIDVRRTADGALAVVHDADLARTGGRSERVASLTWKEIQGVDLSDAPDARIPRWKEPVRVPALREVFEQFPATEITVDVKDPGAAEDVVRLIERFGRVEGTVLFLDSDTDAPAFRGYPGRRATSVSQARRLAIDPGWLDARPERELPEVVHTPLQAEGTKIVTAELVEAIHRSGRSIQVWTIDDIPTMRWLSECGVDAIITNDVRAAVATFGPNGRKQERT